MYEIGVNEMCRLNAAASSIALSVRASSATDVTGFGLLGHLAELATASGLSASINMSQIPLLPNVESLIDQGFVPSGSVRNLDFLDDSVTGGTPSQRLLLADAQTSGGLLFACDESAAEEALHALIETGHTAAIIGRLDDGAPGHITIDS
jgi:selenide,water dikinase